MAAAILLCMTALYFLPVVFTSRTFASRDMYAFFYPRQFFAAQCIKSGILPLWNPHLASGVPFLANLQSSIFYPLSIIYYILPFEVGFKYFIVLHYFLAGFWTYLLMRHWRHDTYSSLVSAVAFMFGGYMVSILDNVAFLTAASWLPLAVLLYDRFLREGRRSCLTLTGVIIGLQMLGGDASAYLLSTVFFLFAYHIYYLFSSTDLSLREKARSLLSLARSACIGICLAAVVLVPFAEFVLHSTRMEGFSYEEMTRWSFHPLELIQLIVPYVFGTTVPMVRWFGQWWLDTFYPGVLTLLLVIISLWWARNRLPLFLMAVAFLSLLLAFGKYNPLFPLCRFIPGINMIHYPVKYLFLAAFSLALLAGMGCSVLFEKLAGRDVKGFTLFLLMLNSAVISLLLAVLFAQESLFQLFQGMYPQTLFHKIVGARSAYQALVGGYSVFLLLLAGSSLLLLFTLRGSMSVRASKIMIIIILVGDLILVGRPRDALLESADYARSNEVVELLKADSSQFRIFSLAYTTFDGFMHIPNVPFTRTFETLQAFLMPNLSLMFAIDTVDEYAEMLVTRYYALFHPVKEYFRDRERTEVPAHFCTTMLNMLNVKYLISSYSLNDDSYKRIRGGSVKIYENRASLPRASMVYKATVYDDDAQVLSAMQEESFDPRTTVFLSREEYRKIRGDDNDNLPEPPAGGGEIKILKYYPNEVEIETIGNDRGFLVLADNCYPGWKAYVNGKREQIARVNYNLRGVYLPPGNNRVVFSFKPISFIIGSSISLLALLATIIIFFREQRKSYCQ